MWVKYPGESMLSTERKSIDLVHGQFLTVPDNINAGGLSTRCAPTIRNKNTHKKETTAENQASAKGIRKYSKESAHAHKWVRHAVVVEVCKWCVVCVLQRATGAPRGHTASEPANRNHRRQTGNQGRERRVQQRYSSVAHQNSAVLPPVRKPRATKPRQGRKRTRKRKKNKQQTNKKKW
jgi:hypothetical protein